MQPYLTVLLRALSLDLFVRRDWDFGVAASGVSDKVPVPSDNQTREGWAIVKRSLVMIDLWDYLFSLYIELLGHV
jgi:hypothetical protein